MERRGANVLGPVAGSLAGLYGTSDLDYVLSNFAPKIISYIGETGNDVRKVKQEIEKLIQNKDIAYLQGENEQLKRRCEEQSALIKSQQATINAMARNNDKQYSR